MYQVAEKLTCSPLETDKNWKTILNFPCPFGGAILAYVQGFCCCKFQQVSFLISIFVGGNALHMEGGTSDGFFSRQQNKFAKITGEAAKEVATCRRCFFNLGIQSPCQMMIG